MAKEPPAFSKFCDRAAKCSIYAVIFLLPVFFLPWTTDKLDFNKQALLLLLVSMAFFCWAAKVLASGRLELNTGALHIFVAILFLAGLLSTIFSVNRYGSFWGWPQITSESLLTLLGLCVFYFLASNIFSKKDIFSLLSIFFVSGIFAEIFAVLNLFGILQSNTIGSAAGMGIFSAVMIFWGSVLLIFVKKWWKILFGLGTILSFFTVLLINFSLVWWTVAGGAVLFIIFGIARRDSFDVRWASVPVFFLAVSVLFVILNIQISFFPQRTNEIFLSQKESISIAWDALKENPVAGSGLGTFAYDFSKFKDKDFSKTPLWNAVFNSAGSKVINDLATTGAVGFLAAIALMIFSVYSAVKFVLTSRQNWIFGLGLLSAVSAQILAYFLYGSNLVLSFSYFFALALLLIFASRQKKIYEIKHSSFITLAITFVFTMAFIFGLGLLFLQGQRYLAEVNYYRGIAKWQNSQKDEGLKYLERAVRSNPSSDLYFRQLAQAYLLKLQDELQKEQPADEKAKKEESDKIQALVANSINAGKIATDLNPKNASNWSLRGYVYQSLLGVIDDAGDWAIKSYDQALLLIPNDSYLFFQKGAVFFTEAARLGKDKTSEKNQFLEQAKDALEKAVNLSPNYSNALYYLGLVYDALGQKDKSIEQFVKVQQLNPGNSADVQKIIDNLKAGRSALQTAEPPVETPPADSTLKNTKE